MASKNEDEREEQVRLLMHPTRVAIITVMGKREMSPSEVAGALGVPKEQMGAIAYHFRPMLDANVLRLTRTTQVRGAIKSHYKVQPNVLKRARKELRRLLAELDGAIEDG